jgi:hypothetical protein
MRDWILLLTPIGLIAFFLVYPDEFIAFINWARYAFG